ncbi:MAG: EAL domain-containing protein [Candidatus Thiodiazotropha sp. (ex Myrtea sp. 'scaly one' KF741663)]|nr:EAL domain-containing protein [Candidatus Thiodiazotropha sp. (ex Myrtea sp. 'scaly one' KF741663)]
MTRLSLNEILTAKVETTSVYTKVSEVLAHMERCQISCIVATDDKRRPLGIFTEQDALRVMANKGVVSDLCMKDVMSTPPLTARTDLDFHDAYRMMTEKSYRHLLVVDNEGSLAGLVSEADFLHHMGMEYLVELKTVDSTMSREVVTLEPSASLVKAVRLMAQRHISCVVICENQYPVGMLTERDIVHLARTLNQSDEITIDTVMQTPVISCQADLPMQEAARLMEKQGIRRLVVTHFEGKLAGLITRHDIVKALQGRYVEYLHETLARTNRDLLITRNVLQETQQKAFLLSLIEQIDDAIYIIEADSGRIIEINDRACEMLGYSRDELRSMMAWELSAGTDDIEKWKQIQTRLKKEGSLTLRTSHRKHNASLIPVEVNAKYLRHEEQDYSLIVARDMTMRDKQMARQRLYATLFENTREGVMVTDSDGIICMVNHAFTELTGYTESEVLGKPPKLLQSGKHDHLYYDKLWSSIKSTGHWQGEIWNRRKNGEIFPELLSISSVRGEQDELQYYVGVFSDISQLKQTEAKLEYLAHHDPLTRLANRRLLMSQLEYGLKAASRKHEMMALLVLDLDRFKDINDSYGHLIGDQLLQQVAGRLSNRLRESDLVTRLGGDEFAVLMQGLDNPGDAAILASEIIQALNDPWQLSDGLELQIGTSIGISLYPDHGDSAEILLQHADTALYQAKNEGRGCFRYFSEELTQAARQRIEIHNNLRHALAEEKLSVFYQPQLDIHSGRIVGAEALLRWQDPVHGNITPSQFIPVAEETGLINRLGEWVLRKVCIQGRAWLKRDFPPLSLAVNLSVHQLRQSGLVKKIAHILEQTGYPAGQLSLEVTESALMERENDAVVTLSQLRDKGIHLSIDDFGTGYSSLAYLQRLPLDELKIDKSFVDEIPYKKEDMEITATIISMANNLGLSVLAEGVETVEQHYFLQQHDCDFYQGYLFSPPVCADDFERLLECKPDTTTGKS